ncbi:glycosyltransferase involved in cell wall biosynthesis [Bradyrhizobium elkanii]
MAQSKGLLVEIFCVLDKSSPLTSEIISTWATKHEHARVLDVQFGDLGLARNSGVATASGEWIAFVDGDDLWGENWLTAAHQAALAEPRSTIWHPEVNLYFSARPHAFVHIDMDDPTFSPSILALTNCWTALCFAKRSVFVDVPYRQVDHHRQIGYEDWAWNIETIALGNIHKIVPGTSHAIRTKEESLVRRTTAAGCLPYPTNMFRDILAERHASRRSSDPSF